MNLYLNGEVGWELNLKLVEEKWNDKITDVYINSLGGDVWEGIAIYNFLKEKEITTHTNGVVASIASVIFLAGKKRIVNQYDDFLIHCPWNIGRGNSEDLQKQSEDLKKIENKLATIYAAETNMTFDEALEQMKKEEFVNPEWLIEKGFANEIYEIKAVATINNKQMNLTETDKSWIETMFTKFSNLLKPPKNIILQDVNGVEVDFYELEPEATPKVGDKAKVDGKPAEGDYVMPSGDTYTFVAGVLETITPKAGDDEVAKLQAEVDRLTAELQAKADAEALKNQEIMALKNEKTQFETEFTNFKAKLKADFGYDGKVEPQITKTRKLQ